MPTVWQHFCIPVDPPSADNPEHSLHISPSWIHLEGRDSHVIALPFPPDQRIQHPFNPWTDPSGQTHPRCLSRKEMYRFRFICEGIMEEWQQREKDEPGFLERAFKEYQDNRRAARQQGQAQSGDALDDR
ncbi:predicted protein [Postia placenta Mad-698-R]|nr:predicted protein [Postia placenta Mad-698-R]